MLKEIGNVFVIGIQERIFKKKLEHCFFEFAFVFLLVSRCI
jgi:hypothetical protein